MNAELSITHLILTASPVVQAVMILLLLASVASWTVIIGKWQVFKRSHEDADEFEERFWGGNDLADLYKEVSVRRDQSFGLEHLFESGFREYAKLHKAGVASNDLINGTQRAMRIELNRDVDQLETQLPFLATVGSTSPYIGLFGTVWGIMNAFIGLGNVHQATLAMVAPGIAEALIATAMGLFAAIPAVIFYNRYANEVERLYTRYDNFVEEFSAILQRQVRGGQQRASQSHGEPVRDPA